MRHGSRRTTTAHRPSMALPRRCSRCRAGGLASAGNSMADDMKPGTASTAAATCRCASRPSTASGRQTPERRRRRRVCECCPTSVVVTADGPVAVYPHRRAGEIRDIYVADSRGASGRVRRQSPRKTGSSTACPVNGPALAVNGRDVALELLTGKDAAVPQAFLAFSSDAGRTFSAPVRGWARRHPARPGRHRASARRILAAASRTLGGKPRLQLRRIDRFGARSAAITIAESRMDAPAATHARRGTATSGPRVD